MINDVCDCWSSNVFILCHLFDLKMKLFLCGSKAAHSLILFQTEQHNHFKNKTPTLLHTHYLHLLSLHI